MCREYTLKELLQILKVANLLELYFLRLSKEELKKYFNTNNSFKETIKQRTP